MSIFTAIDNDFEAFWSAHIKPFLTNDVEPALKKFVSQFDSKFGSDAIALAMTAVSSLESGSAFGAVATGLASSLFNDARTDASQTAELDAAQILATVQSALQVAKIASGIVTPTDQTAAASLSAAP